jgi:hypothetical protein
MPLLAHEHRWLGVTATDDPDVVVEDCGCGARRRVRVIGGQRESIDDDNIIEGGSFYNAIFRCAQGVPTRDRWHTTQ